jgi:hypothetical protein
MSITSKSYHCKVKFNFLLLAITISYISLCVTDNIPIKSNKVPLEEKKREKYYSKILKESIQHTNFQEISMSYDTEGFFLALNADLSEKELIAVVNKKHIISSCEFFPFRDSITGLIVRYCNTNFKMNKEVAVPLFTLVYRMLYLRFGDKERSYKFYSHFLSQKDSNEFYNYELSSSIKDYMMNMKLEKNSSLSFDEDELTFTKNLKLDLSQHEFALDLFDFIFQGVKVLKEEAYRDSMLPIVNNKEYFKKYLEFVFTHGRHIKVKEFALLYQKQYEETYTNYHKTIADKFNISNSFCLLVMPLLDLIRQSPEPDSQLRMTLRSEYGLGFSFQKNKNKNSKLFVSIENDEPITNEKLYLDWGIKSDQYNRTLVNFKFYKKDFTPKKFQLCKKIGCVGFNIDFLNSNKLEEFDFGIVIDENINYSLLNIFKILNLQESKINEAFHSAKLESFTNFDSELQIQALANYIIFMRNIDKTTGSYVSIIDLSN